MRKIKKILQTDLKDCGVTCLMSIINYYGGYAEREYLRKITSTTNEGVSVYSLVNSANVLGFEAKALKGDILNIKNNTPFIAHMVIDNKLGHFVVVYKVNKTIKVMDPASGFKTYSLKEWQELSTNVYILYKPVKKIIKQQQENNFLKFCFPLIKKYKFSIFIIIFFSLIYSCSEIIIILGIKKIINIDIFKISYFFVLLILALILKELTNLFRSFLISYLEHSIEHSLCMKIYNHIIRLPYLYFKNHTKEDIVIRIKDAFKIKNLISKLFVTLFIDCIFIVIILLFVLQINYLLVLFILFISLIYAIIIFIFNNNLNNNIKTLKEKEVVFTNHLMESVNSIETIKGMTLVNYFELKLDNKHTDMQNVSFKLETKWSSKNFYQNLIAGIGFFLIFYISLKYLHLNISELFVLYSLYTTYFETINNIAMLHLDFKDSKISFIRIIELLNIPKESLNALETNFDKKLKGKIKINNLRFSYNGINNVLKCSNLYIKGGSKILLYGASGEGKSTLMKLFNRFLDDYKGTIKIDNQNIDKYNLLFLRTKVTYLSCNDIIYNTSLYENITLGNKISSLKYAKVLNICGIDKILKRSMLGSNMILENNGYNLSNGEKERVIIARGLVRDSDIYIFDEVTNSLDIKSERILLEQVFKFLKEKTVIVISHRFNNRDLYNQFILIKGGKVYGN